MVDSYSFGSFLESGADLAFKAGVRFAAGLGNLSAKEAQDVGTLEGADRMADKFRVKLLELRGLIEEHIGGVFTLGSTPVVAQAGHGSRNFAMQRMGELQKGVHQGGPIGA